MESACAQVLLQGWREGCENEKAESGCQKSSRYQDLLPERGGGVSGREHERGVVRLSGCSGIDAVNESLSESPWHSLLRVFPGFVLFLTHELGFVSRLDLPEFVVTPVLARVAVAGALRLQNCL